MKKKDALPEEGNKAATIKLGLATRGFQQIHGVDYNETFAPIIKFTTLCLYLGVVAAGDLDLHQVDDETAIPNGDQAEKFYREQPEGCIDASSSGHACELKNALYGPRQAPRQWYSKINDFLIRQLGFF